MIETIFDTETTGLVENRTLRIARQPEIIEFYACEVDLDSGTILRELDLLIKPRLKIPDFIVKHTGITNEMVEAAPPFEDVADSIVEFLERADVTIAHNVSFDKDVVEIELQRLQRKINWKRSICTIEQSMHITGHRMNLSALHLHLLKEKFAGAHRAKADVAALIRCCVELRKQEAI